MTQGQDAHAIEAGKVGQAPHARKPVLPMNEPKPESRNSLNGNEEIETAVRRVLSGNADAFEVIVNAYRQSVWQWASYALEGADETQDIVQETFVEAFRHIEKFESGRDMGGWLFGIARNAVRQKLRRRARNERWFRLYEYSLREDPTWRDPDRDEREAALRACMERLPGQTRNVLGLRYEEGWDYGRIASSLNKSVSAARQFLQRTRDALRECIETRSRTT